MDLSVELLELRDEGRDEAGRAEERAEERWEEELLRWDEEPERCEDELERWLCLELMLLNYKNKFRVCLWVCA